MTGLKRVALLDTAVASTNLGDRIIMDAVRRELAPLIGDAFPFDIATHEWMGSKSRSLIRRSDLAVVGGTSLLSSHIGLRSTWKLSPLDGLAGLNLVLMGAGWRAYQGRSDPYSAWLLRSVLSRKRVHSVRDGYSARKLAALGLDNVLNTACPTLWALTPERLAATPREQGQAAVVTLSAHFGRPQHDRELLQLLARCYETVYFWPQSDEDFAYVRDLGDAKLTHLAPTLEAYDALLRDAPSLDHVGVRLHGGIRALQHGRRTLIIEVDNRAKTIAEDVALPTVARGDAVELERRIRSSFETRLKLPWQAIQDWKSQLVADW